MIDRFYRDSGTRFHSHNAFDTTNKGPLLCISPSFLVRVKFPRDSTGSREPTVRSRLNRSISGFITQFRSHCRSVRRSTEYSLNCDGARWTEAASRNPRKMDELVQRIYSPVVFDFAVC